MQVNPFSGETDATMTDMCLMNLVLKNKYPHESNI